jgi:hypothetical protein
MYRMNNNINRQCQCYTMAPIAMVVHKPINRKRYDIVPNTHTHTHTNVQVAIKVINMERVSTEFRDKFLPRETCVHKQLVHEYIVRMYDTFMVNVCFGYCKHTHTHTHTHTQCILCRRNNISFVNT